MQSTTRFVGLTMPVFTAFGWAGEEAALEYALSQLEVFIDVLHANLRQQTRTKLPAFGLDRKGQSVYLAASSDPSSDIYIAFNARPLSFELQLILEDKEAIGRGLKHALNNPLRFHRLVTELGPDWTLRVQQMELDDDSGEASHYQDLFKDTVGKFDEETADSVVSRAAYLNGEAQWITPIYLSRRFASEKVAAMGSDLIQVMGEEVEGLIPLITFLAGIREKTGRQPKTTPSVGAKAESEAVVEAPTVVPENTEVDLDVGFDYVSELKPLHIRRGFINLTPEHWPFFAVNSRTTIREVTVYYEGIYDKKSTVWRLVPNDQARLVLSPKVHEWLENSLAPNEKVHVVARKLDDDEIQLSLKSLS